MADRLAIATMGQDWSDSRSRSAVVCHGGDCPLDDSAEGPLRSQTSFRGSAARGKALIPRWLRTANPFTPLEQRLPALARHKWPVTEGGVTALLWAARYNPGCAAETTATSRPSLPLPPRCVESRDRGRRLWVNDQTHQQRSLAPNESARVREMHARARGAELSRRSQHSRRGSTVARVQISGENVP